jgi:hypothetical protein
MLQAYRILETACCSEIDNKYLALLLSLSEHEVPRHNLIMNKIFEVEVLQNRDDFLP